MRSILNPGHRAGCLLLLLCALLLAQPRLGASELLGPDGTPRSPGEDGDWVPDQLIVKFRPGAVTLPPEADEGALSELDLSADVARLFTTAGVQRVRKVFRSFAPDDTMRTLKSGQRVVVTDLSQIFMVDLATGAHVPTMVQAFEAYPGVIYAEPDYLYAADDEPTDERFPEQWALQQSTGEDIDASSAWDIETGDYSVKIAILDSGIDYAHADLGSAFGPTWKVSGGWDYVHNDPDPMDDRYHGTHVAGIAAALTHNFYRVKTEPCLGRSSHAIGTAGVAGGWGYLRYYNSGNKGAQVIASKVINAYGQAAISNIAAGIYGAINDSDVDVLNASLGGDSPSYTLGYAVKYAAEMNRVFVASKGNNGNDHLHYPSDFTENWVISVGATDRFGNRWPDSNYGNWIDVVAPGVDILSTVPTFMTDAMAGSGYPTHYHELTGTSMAAPHVAGLAALILSRNPYLHAEDVQGLVKAGTEETAYDPNPGYDGEYGFGRINARNALEFLSPPWTLNHDVASGGTAVGNTTGTMRFIEPGPLETAWYIAKRYDVRKTVPINGFEDPVFVWGVGMNSSTAGWSSHPFNFQTPFCEAVSFNENSAELRTFVYEVWELTGRYRGWYPCRPYEVVYNYTILGVPQATGAAADGGPTCADRTMMPSLPRDYALEQNRPNPVAGATEIRFQLPEGSEVSLKVYDLDGREVVTLREGVLSSGYHVVLCDASEFPNGVYVYTMRTPVFCDSRRMIVSRQGEWR